jgi:uncharacterized protein
LTAYFVDSSALAKRYIIETGSEWVRSWILPAHKNQIVISVLSTVEVISLLMRREREGAVSTQERIRVQNNFMRHSEDEYYTIDVDNNVLGIARQLLARHPLRTLDAIQLASALQAAAALRAQPTFVCADQRLLTAASSEGLPIDNPNLHTG